MMHTQGLTKLIEECGELVQIAAKKQAFMNTDSHPDGKESMKVRLEEEIADVLAACAFVIENFNLHKIRIGQRKKIKLNTFRTWNLRAKNITLNSLEEQRLFEANMKSKHPLFPLGKSKVSGIEEVVYFSAGTQHRWISWQEARILLKE